MIRAWLGTALLAGLALPVARAQLERAMIAHMLVQIPLLAIAGALIATDVPAAWKARISVWNRGGIAGTLLAILVSSWWMVPRALDSALASPEAELLKFVSLPLLVGTPAALSWRALGRLGRGFAIANVLPMWAVVGWMYVAAPSRVCNYYLVDQQVTAGTGLLWLSVVAGGIACAAAFRSSIPHVSST
jgi:hypothetical protein